MDVPPPPPPPPPQSPSPPPPPPPPVETIIPQPKEINFPGSYKSNLQTLLSYPPLTPHEKHLSKSPYDVKSWYLYLSTINHLLSSLSTLHEDNMKSLESKGRASILNDFILGSSFEADDNLIIPANNIPSEIRKLNKARLFISQRATTLLPGSYKLWKDYLDFVLETYFPSKHQYLYSVYYTNRIKYTMNAFELALRQRMNKMPRIWIMYLTFLQSYTNDITYIRRVYNRALKSLPTTQHDLIWNECNTWLQQDHIPIQTKLTLLYRYSHEFDLSKREEYIKICMDCKEYNKAATTLLHILNEEDYTSPNGTTKAKLWNTFVQICTSHPTKLNFDLILRTQLLDPSKKDMAGYLWNSLALYYIKNGEYEIGRSVYEEALEKVERVRDFSIVFDAYMSLEEGVISALMTLDAQDGNDDDLSLLLNKDKQSSTTEMELALARAEYLMERRPLLLNRVLLRQNPHNVQEWLHRSQLYLKLDQRVDAISTLQTASTKVISKHSMNGSPCMIFITLAGIYEDSGDIESARKVYKSICQEFNYKFHAVDDLAQCYTAWIEMELRHDNFDTALSLSRLSIAKQPTSSDAVSKRLFKSIRLWNLLLDLEEGLGTIQTTKSSYKTCLEWGIATPSILFNYADFLMENAYFEEAFSVFEKGVETFPAFPIIGKIWKRYTAAFVEHYKGSKIERTRDLYERCLDSINNKTAKDEEDCIGFYLDYAKWEDSYGSFTSRILSIYERLCTFITTSKEKYMAYQLYIAKVEYYLGITKTRPIYERAIASLQDLLYVTKTCLDYANMELSLQEIDRARSIFLYGSQFANPSSNNEELYYKPWQEFEVEYGNEDTFREMLRVKRSVVIKYSTDVNYNHTSEDKEEEDAATKFLKEDEALQMIANSEGLGDVTSSESRKRHYEDVLNEEEDTEEKETKVVKKKVNTLQSLEERVEKLKQVVEQPDMFKDEDEICLDEEEKDMGALERLQAAK